MAEFTGGLWQHQVEAFNRMNGSPEQGYALFLEMGCGKTRPAIRKMCEARRTCLVVTPKSAIDDAWLGEIERTSTLKAVALVGSKHQRVKTLQTANADVYVINYEGLAVLADYFLAMEFGVVVFDESHRLANRTTKQSKIAARIALLSDFVLLLSGTPVRSDSRDLWHQIYLLDQGKRLGRKFYGFQSTNFRNIQKPGSRIPFYVPLKGSEKKIRDAIADVVYVVKKVDVLPNLPPKVYHKRFVMMTDEQIVAYVDMAEQMVVELERQESGEVPVATARTILTRYLRLHQIAQGFLYDDNKTVVAEWEPNPKTHELLEILKDHDGKAVVWCIYRHTIESLEKTLKIAGYNPVTLYGGTADPRGAIWNFQHEKDVRVIIGQPAKGGEGVNLSAADMAVYFTNSFSWPRRVQSEDRSNRPGSEGFSSTNIVDIVAKGTIDIKILDALKKKKSTADLLLDFREHINTLADLRRVA